MSSPCAWRPPSIEFGKGIGFTILGNSPYTPGDYQMHGIRDLFYPHYLQTEKIYADTMGEDYAISAAPYGESVDYLLSDVRQEALLRYGLVIWTGAPPMAPSMVRDKLLRQLGENGGRVVLFGAAVRSMFPEWFAHDPAEKIASGAQVAYGGKTFSETADFTLEHLRDGSGREHSRSESARHGQRQTAHCRMPGPDRSGTQRLRNQQHARPRPVRGEVVPRAAVTEIPHALLNHGAPVAGRRGPQADLAHRRQ